MLFDETISTVEELQVHWRDQYKQWYAAGMPAFNNSGVTPFHQLKVNFPTQEDRDTFAKLLELDMTEKTKAFNYPVSGRHVNMLNRYEEPHQEVYTTKYPIYIISKGRWETRHTSKALEKMGVPYYIAVEPQEYDKYCEVIDPAKVLKLPFSNHGKGSGPARNWCWEHSLANGHDRHWLMDDNIAEFWRFQNNRRYRVERGSGIFRASEDFVDRHENIGLAGLQYKFFCIDNEPYPPYMLNTRMMSCILINNHLPMRWRGKYNEDVDLSIRVLKEGYCTILFYAFLCGKLRTGTVKGGNTSEVYNGYEGDASFKKSQMLKEMHPECITVKERYGRVHHFVDLDAIINKDGYSARQNVPILKKDVDIINDVDNYGMSLIRNWGETDSYVDHDFTKHIYPTGRKSIHG
jgi:hypothetical protein